MNQTFEVTIIDEWPKLKLIIRRGPNVRHEGPFQYDIANSQFEPAVKDTLRSACEVILNSRKRSS
jgi:hypothetical protein